MTDLIFKPRTPVDADLFGQMLVDNGFSPNWDVKEGFFRFSPDDAEDHDVDDLECELEGMICGAGIHGYFEAVEQEG